MQKWRRSQLRSQLSPPSISVEISVELCAVSAESSTERTPRSTERSLELSVSAGELSGAQAERAPGTAERSPSRPAGPSGSASKLSADLRASGACPLSCGRPDHLGDGLRTFTRAVCAAPRDRAHRRWNRSPNASAARSQRCFHAAAPQVCCVLDVAILQPSAAVAAHACPSSPLAEAELVANRTIVHWLLALGCFGGARFTSTQRVCSVKNHTASACITATMGAQTHARSRRSVPRSS